MTLSFNEFRASSKNNFTTSLNFSLSVHSLSKITDDGLPRPVQIFPVILLRIIKTSQYVLPNHSSLPNQSYVLCLYSYRPRKQSTHHNYHLPLHT